MDALAELHQRAADWTGGIVAGIRPEQFGLPTPCAEWDVRTLLHHIVYENLWVGDLMSGRTIDEVGERYEGDVLGEDYIRAYMDSAKLACEAVAVPGAMDMAVPVSYGPIPGEAYTRHRLLDLVVHGWDLATATAQPNVIPTELLEPCAEIVADEYDNLRESGAFGIELEVPEDATAQQKLLAKLGRETR